MREYNHLFVKENPDDAPDGNFLSNLNPDSLKVIGGCKLEPALAALPQGSVVQFERIGYFCVDTKSTSEKPVFNRTVTLRDEWAKIAKKEAGK